MQSLGNSDVYDIAVEVVDRVGWNTGDKKGSPTYRRDPADGTFILDEDSELVLDSDFDAALANIRQSDAVQDFSWLTRNAPTGEISNSAWSITSDRVVGDPYYTLDPKRLSRKYHTVVEGIRSVDHFRFADVLDVVPEAKNADGSAMLTDRSAVYDYVELQSVDAGAYRAEPIRGWELPTRAKHGAEPGDIFVGAVWSSVRKWMMVGEANSDIRVTNGMHRLRLKPEFEHRRVDVIAALCSEAYRVQMRALSRGSDGLAEISADDLLNVVAPVLDDDEVRGDLEPFISQLMRGHTSVEAKVASLASASRLPGPDVAKRANHVMVL